MNDAIATIERALEEGRLADFGRPDDPDDLCDFEERHWRGRTVSAGALAKLVRGADQNALRVRCVRVTGELRLQDAELKRPLVLQRTLFDDAIRLDGVRAPRIDLSGSCCKTLRAAGVALDGDLVVDRLRTVGGVELRAARIKGRLSAKDAVIGGLDARSLQLDGEATLRRLRSTARVDLTGARIGPFLDLQSASLEAEEGSALEAPLAEVRGYVSLRGAHVAGTVWFVDAKLGASFVADKGHFQRPSRDAMADAGRRLPGLAINLERASIDGFIFVKDARVDGTLRLFRVHAAGIRGENSTFDGLKDAVDGELAHFDGNVVFRNARVKGQFRLFASKVGADVVLDGARFSRSEAQDPGDYAITARSCSVGGNFLAVGTTISGGLHAFGLTCSTLECRGATITPAPDGFAVRVVYARIGALHFEDASVHGRFDVSFSTVGENLVLNGATFKATQAGHAIRLEGTSVAGPLRACGTRVSGSVRLFRASAATVELDGLGIDSPSGVALDATGLNTASHVHLRGVVIRGELLFRNARVGGSLDLGPGYPLMAGEPGAPNRSTLTRGVSFTSARIAGDLDRDDAVAEEPRVALDLEQATVAGTLDLGAASVDGAVALLNTKVAGDVSCSGLKIRNPHSVSIDAVSLRCEGALVLRGCELDGRLDLSYASVAVLRDEVASWPDEMEIDGFRYGDLDSADRSWKQHRRGWIRRQAVYHAQPYLQLAAIYRAIGREREARKVNIERHNDRMRSPNHGGPQPWRQFLRFAIGHGYEPWRALVPVLVLLAIGWWVYSDAKADRELVPTRPSSTATSDACDSKYPCMEPLVYALDALAPVINLHQRDFWQPDASRAIVVAICTWVLILMGWLLFTVVIAGFTNAIKRE